MANDIIEDLLGLDMELKPEYKDEDERTMKVGCKGESWKLPFVEAFDLLGLRSRRTGKGIQGTEKTLRKGMGLWWRRKCDRVVSHVFSTALKESVRWPRSVERMMRVKR